MAAGEKQKVAVDVRPAEDDDPTAKPQDKWNDTAVLVACFFGLQVFYLVWGVLQEKLMTQEYSSGKFTSSGFLVFANRLAAIIVAVALTSWSKAQGHPQGSAPMYQYFFPAFGNVCSSFSAYEALKHVSFPLQVLSKASKLIPVMLMGKIVQRKRYETKEYVQACILTLGVAMFFYSERVASGRGGNSTDSSLLGILLLVIYILADAFTSQYQDKINKTYHATEFEMMFGMNFFSIIVTFLGLVVSKELMPTIHFLMGEPAAFYDVTVLSLSACLGQLVIYFTLKRFGPIVFSLIMMIRQIFSLVLSCVLYGHPIGGLGFLGISIVFGVIFYRWHSNRRK